MPPGLSNLAKEAAGRLEETGVGGAAEIARGVLV